MSGEKNKYQGGVLADDGHVYAIPSNSEHILCIDTNTNNKRISLVDEGRREKGASFLEKDAALVIGDIPPIKDKWQGKR